MRGLTPRTVKRHQLRYRAYQAEVVRLTDEMVRLADENERYRYVLNIEGGGRWRERAAIWLIRRLCPDREVQPE